MQVDRFFDQHLVAGSEKLVPLVADAVARLKAEEARKSTRLRSRRDCDGERLRQSIETVIANLVYATIDSSGPQTIAVSLSKQRSPSRYDRPIFRQLPRTLVQLQACGLLHLSKPQARGRSSTITPSVSLARKIKRCGIGFADFGRFEREELIVLSRTEDRFGSDGSFGKRRRWIDYKHDTPDTLRFRDEMQRINVGLELANLEFMPDDNSPIAYIDIYHRRLRRYFTLPPWQADDTPRFDLGGRLFGNAFWVNLPREERHRIRIDDEPVVDLDFASMFPRLAYLTLGLTPPDGDLYAGIQGLEDPKHRDGVKGALNTLLFANGPKNKMPSEFRKALPSGWTFARVRSAIAARHPDLEPVFETGIGLQLMFTESQMMVALILRLADRGIVGLPMHDGVMVSRSKATDARRMMMATAKDIVGFGLPVSEKGL